MLEHNKKTPNAPFVKLSIHSIIIIWAIWNLQYIKFKALKSIFLILKKHRLNIFEEKPLLKHTHIFLIRKLFNVFRVQNNTHNYESIRLFKTKVINIKHQPLLNKLTENCIKLRYHCNLFYVENVHVNNTWKPFNSATCSQQLHSHVWTIFLILEPFSHIF